MVAPRETATGSPENWATRNSPIFPTSTQLAESWEWIAATSLGSRSWHRLIRHYCCWALPSRITGGATRRRAPACAAAALGGPAGLEPRLAPALGQGHRRDQALYVRIPSEVGHRFRNEVGH